MQYTNEDSQEKVKGSGILLVDDDPLVLKILDKILCANGYRTFPHRSPNSAYQTLEVEELDLIICDVMMPGIDGHEFYRSIKDNSNFAQIPFVFITALDDNVSLEKGYMSGADTILSKPLEPKVLLQIVQGKVLRAQMLRKAQSSALESNRRRIIQTLSHEFRTPLVAVNTGSELLIREFEGLDLGEKQDKLVRILEAVKRGGERLEKLVNDFMIMQQIDSGMMSSANKLKQQNFSVYILLEKFFTNFCVPLKNEGFEIISTIAEEKVEVCIDSDTFTQILQRLLNNAIKFSEEFKSISLNTELTDSEVVIIISDRGKGFDPALVQTALNPFEQINRDFYEQQGSGLGLAIANSLAGLTGGRVELRHRKSGGTSACLILPVLK